MSEDSDDTKEINGYTTPRITPSPIFQRLICTAFDDLIWLIFIYFVILAIFRKLFLGYIHLPYLLIVTIFICEFLKVVYFAFMHWKFGQTLGKMLGKIYLVSSTGECVTKKQAIFRALLVQGLPFFNNTFLRLIITQETVELGTIITRIIIGYIILDYSFMIFDRKQKRAFHDYLLNTRVIKKHNYNICQ